MEIFYSADFHIQQARISIRHINFEVKRSHLNNIPESVLVHTPLKLFPLITYGKFIQIIFDTSISVRVHFTVSKKNRVTICSAIFLLWIPNESVTRPQSNCHHEDHSLHNLFNCIHFLSLFLERLWLPMLSSAAIKISGSLTTSTLNRWSLGSRRANQMELDFKFIVSNHFPWSTDARVSIVCCPA